jgi:hypothetical protein
MPKDDLIFVQRLMTASYSVNEVSAAYEGRDGLRPPTLMKKENWPELVALTSTFLVELPGIEPVAKMALSWENTGFDDAKRHEITSIDTCGYAEGVDGINTPLRHCVSVPLAILLLGAVVLLQCFKYRGLAEGRREIGPG